MDGFFIRVVVSRLFNVDGYRAIVTEIEFTSLADYCKYIDASVKYFQGEVSFSKPSEYFYVISTSGWLGRDIVIKNDGEIEETDTFHF
jgi:hypothetical protein